jgi:hypothetical protein
VLLCCAILWTPPRAGAARYGGLFERTSDAESDAALLGLTAALSRAALALAAGTKEENATRAALVPPKERQVDLGPISLSLNAQQAGIGAGVAYTFAYGSSRLTGIYNGDPDVQFAAAVKAAEAAEIRVGSARCPCRDSSLNRPPACTAKGAAALSEG